MHDRAEDLRPAVKQGNDVQISEGDWAKLSVHNLQADWLKAS